VKVLIVRIGAMGDVLHAMPAVAALRQKHPDWFIGWAIEPRWSDLLQMAGDYDDMSQAVGRFASHALVDRWYSVTTGAWKVEPFSRRTHREMGVLRDVLRREQFDLCVDMQGSLKSAVVARMAKASVLVGADKPRERVARWFYNHKAKTTAAHVVEQGCELLSEAVGETLRPVPVTLPMDEMDERWADEMVGREPFCLISPGGGWGSKIWPAERFGRVAAVLGRAGIRSVVNTAPKGSAEADRCVAASDGFARAAPGTVGQLVALTRRASVVVASDTGPLHLAAALERPVVAIFGPTDPARNGPYGTRSRVLRSAGSVTSYKRLIDAEDGLLRIEVEDVAAATLELLG
jgi:heptosyltransferase-1